MGRKNVNPGLKWREDGIYGQMIYRKITKTNAHYELSKTKKDLVLDGSKGYQDQV